MYTADVDFCAAIRARGRKILFTPNVAIVHLRGPSAATSGGTRSGQRPPAPSPGAPLSARSPAVRPAPAPASPWPTPPADPVPDRLAAALPEAPPSSADTPAALEDLIARVMHAVV